MNPELKEKLEEFCRCFEKEEKFLNIEQGNYKKLIYHLYEKFKRTSLLYIDAFNSTTLKFPEIELIPLLRVLIETNLHLTYVLKGIDNKNEIEKMYEQNEKHGFWLTAKLLNEKKEKTPEEQKFIDRFYKGKEDREPKRNIIFKSIKVLAQKTNKEIFYYNYYLAFNNFVHYNSSTYVNYTYQEDNNHYFYSSGKRSLDHSEELQKVFDMVILNTFAELNVFLGSDEIADKYNAMYYLTSLKDVEIKH
ncbi:DUF5677 domain-containing protein [Shouchella clausii]|uniref:DUF5677 domain-containing protein n=3 Tax=Shouchella clausii TaxID=79880 RepID=UPI000B975423|nr:DUF5677 domain-containing protein [Shouchella clausii]AST97279.1 hypothetical protein BC8716_15485 [Shouchella clausii]MCR1287837.1 DUF5677 domain-containing protein [Shouchella clausii]MCY1107108.1 DUF5677 domain-containing protein [Shouchella clausii]MEB5473183.1 DUF5677 domain-containing protein [Shouchella clausii]QNM43635.1 hypothetical protein DUT88_12345 [Shouchella clausii]